MILDLVKMLAPVVVRAVVDAFRSPKKPAPEVDPVGQAWPYSAVAHKEAQIRSATTAKPQPDSPPSGPRRR